MYLRPNELVGYKNLARRATYQSVLQERTPASPIEIPPFTGPERWYMVKVMWLNGLEEKLARWNRPVDDMLNCYGIKPTCKMPAYVTIDYRHISAGQWHRRGGLHVDGNWIEVEAEVPRKSGHGAKGGTYTELQGMATHHPYRYDSETMLLWSNVGACIGYKGQFKGEIQDGGDCSLIDPSGMEKVTLQAGVVYAGNETFLHESTPVPVDCTRCLIRVVVPKRKLR